MDRLLTETELILMLASEDIIPEFDERIAKASLGGIIEKTINHTMERQDEKTARLVAKEIIQIIETHCKKYQWITDPDNTKWHYPFCPTDLEALKQKYGVKDGK